MIYPQNFEDKIEFSSIREYIDGYCISSLGKDKLNNVRFSTNLDEITLQINQTLEFVNILKLNDFPDLSIYDLRLDLKRIKVIDSYLTATELFAFYKSLRTISNIVTYLSQKTESSNVDEFKYPCLHLLTENKLTFPDIYKCITKVLTITGEIKDSASNELFRIRKEKAIAEKNVSKILQSILKNAQNEGYVDASTSPAIRDGRLVIPVAPAYKRKINGIVHDESDTGKTIYIEPTQVVEANNLITELENEERKEIIKILKSITAQIRPHISDILNSFNLLADVDFIRAKAKLTIQIDGRRPIINNTPLLHWNHAIHPLLKIFIAKKQSDKQDVIPLDIALESPNQRILLISGPNAGGKSVCLKTVGLLQYMLQCGFPIPIAEDSTCGIFKDIFINIGDEQSIENELSTFSSHLLNMKIMMKNASAESLLLIDEFGGGTEPMIGGALAQAMLKKLNNNQVFAVITTHFQNLKQYAQETNGIVNAAMLYDRNEMRPLFQLRIGNPGSSFAVEIARKIGIPQDVIKEAAEIVGNDYISSDKYIQDIIRDKRYWENKRNEIHQKEKKMDQLMNQYEQDVDKLKEEKRKIIAKAKEEAKSLLNNSNSIIERTIKEIKEAQAEKEQTKLVRSELESFKQEMDAKAADELEAYIQRKVESIKNRKKRKEERKAKLLNEKFPQNTNPIIKDAQTIEFKDGDFVKLKDQQTIGKVLKISSKEALVAFGGIQMNVKLRDLKPSAPPPPEKKATTFVSKQTQNNIRETTLNFKSEIDVRGMRAEEAIQAITYFVDDAVVASVHRLRILHGTGNGILRTVIRQYLSTVKNVVSTKDELPQYGGSGITIVELE